MTLRSHVHDDNDRRRSTRLLHRPWGRPRAEARRIQEARPWWGNESPVTDTDELMAQSRQETLGLDRALSVGAWVDGRLAALALVFLGDDGIEVVAETLHPEQPHGRELVAGVLATLIEKLAVSGGGHVSIDGHVTDPHLQPVLDHIPHEDAHPADLIEID